MKKLSRNSGLPFFMSALVMMCGISGCKRGDTATLPEAPKPAEIPEYLGLYLTDGGKLTRLDKKMMSVCEEH